MNFGKCSHHPGSGGLRMKRAELEGLVVEYIELNRDVKKPYRGGSWRGASASITCGFLGSSEVQGVGEVSQNSPRSSTVVLSPICDRT